MASETGIKPVENDRGADQTHSREQTQSEGQSTARNRDAAGQRRDNTNASGTGGAQIGIVLWCNLVLAFATVCLVGVTAWLVAITQQSVNVATDSLALTRDTAQKQLRAYISPVKAEVRGNSVRVTVRNAGQTPAFKTAVFISTKRVGPPVAGALPVEEGQHHTLAAGEEIFVDHPIDAPRNGKLHALVEVEYEDVFGITHLESFKFAQRGNRSPEMILTGTTE